MKHVLAAAAAAVLFPAAALAAPLADRVPASSVIYVGWAGTESLAESAEGTDAGALMEATNFDALVTDVLPQVFDLIGRESPDFDAATARSLLEVTEMVARYPTTVFFGGMTVNPDDNEPLPKLGIIVEAGERGAAELRAKLAEVTQRSGNMIPLFLMRTDGDHFLMYVGFTDLEIGLNLADAAAPLADVPLFEDAMQAVDEDDSQYAVYVDGEKLRQMIDSAVADGNDAEAQKNWPLIRDVLGVGDIDAVAATGGMRDGLWETRRFVMAPTPRRGLLALHDEAGGGMDRDLLAAVPADATRLHVTKFDTGRFFDLLREFITATDPEADGQINQGLGVLNVFVGANVERDLIRNLGPDWAVYQSPGVLPGPGGFVAVNKLNDPKRGARAIGAVSTALVTTIRTQAMREQPQMTLNGHAVEIDGVRVWYVGTPLVTPAWAVKDGYLVAGLYPQAVAAAANAIGSDTNILEVESVAAALDAAGEDARGIGFADLPRTTPGAYAGWLPVVRTLDGVPDMLRGVDAAGPLVPTLPTLLGHVSPAWGATWADDEGLHSRGVKPFPLADVVLQEQPLASVAVLQAGVLLPALGEARENAAEVASMSQLRQIGLAATMYANDHDGKLPPDIASMYATGILSADMFLSPRHGRELPGRWNSMNRREQGAWLNENSDFVYLADDAIKVAALDNATEVPIAVERRGGLEPDAPVLIVFADGHVEAVPMGRARDLLFELNRARRAAGLEDIEPDALR